MFRSFLIPVYDLGFAPSGTSCANTVAGAHETRERLDNMRRWNSGIGTQRWASESKPLPALV